MFDLHSRRALRRLAAPVAALAALAIFATGLAAQEPPPASAIPKAADKDGKAAAKSAKKAKAKAVVCESMFEAACKEAEGCAWTTGSPGADGAAAKGSCIKVDKSAAKGTKDSCPSMFEALCRETSGCDWKAGTPTAEGAAAAPGGCTFIGKAKKSAPTKKAAAPPPAPDTFSDQQ